MNKLMVVLPAYNEEENIEILVKNWQQHKSTIFDKYGLELKIVIVNDGSRDKTLKIGEKMERQYSNCYIVNHSKNKGLGEAVKTGILYGIKNCVDKSFVCIMDCDNTQDPLYILDMLKVQKDKDADVVIASRYQEGAEVKGLSKARLLTSIGARFMYTAVLNVKNVKDYTCGYRLYKIQILKKAYERFRDKIIEESGFTCMAELLYKLYCCGAKFEEIPFKLRYDFKLGTSKMEIIKTSINSIKIALKLKRIKKQF